MENNQVLAWKLIQFGSLQNLSNKSILETSFAKNQKSKPQNICLDSKEAPE